MKLSLCYKFFALIVFSSVSVSCLSQPLNVNSSFEDMSNTGGNVSSTETVGPITTVTRRDGGVFRDDSIEIFIDSVGNGSCYHLAFNSLGIQYDGKMLDKTWDGQWQVKTIVSDTQWQSEVVIPFSMLGITADENTQLRFNICRNDKSVNQSSSWAPSPSQEGYHSYEGFAKAILSKGYGSKITEMTTATIQCHFGSMKLKVQVLLWK